MSIERNKNGDYIVRWREGGKHRSKIIGSKADARAFEDDMRRRRRMGGVEYSRSEQPMSEFLEEWWAIKQASLSNASRESYAGAVNRYIEPFFAPYRLCDVGTDTVEEFMADLAGQGKGLATQEKVHSVLHMIFAKAVRGRRIMFNPVSSVPKPRARRKHKVQAFPPERVEAIRAQLDLEEATFVSLCAYSGPRIPSEPLALTWKDIDEANIYYGGMKTNKPRATELLTPLAEDLTAWQKESGVMVGNVFKWTAGQYRGFRERLRDDHGLARAYDLRHAYVTLRLQEGRTLGWIAEQMGNTLSACEDHYAHLSHLSSRAIPAEEATRCARNVRGDERAESQGRT